MWLIDDQRVGWSDVQLNLPGGQVRHEQKERSAERGADSMLLRRPMTKQYVASRRIHSRLDVGSSLLQVEINTGKRKKVAGAMDGEDFWLIVTSRSTEDRFYSVIWRDSVWHATENP